MPNSSTLAHTIYRYLCGNNRRTTTSVGLGTSFSSAGRLLKLALHSIQRCDILFSSKDCLRYPLAPLRAIWVRGAEFCSGSKSAPKLPRSERTASCLSDSCPKIAWQAYFLFATRFLTERLRVNYSRPPISSYSRVLRASPSPITLKPLSWYGTLTRAVQTRHGLPRPYHNTLALGP